jgi:hypothetical protein
MYDDRIWHLLCAFIALYLPPSGTPHAASHDRVLEGPGRPMSCVCRGAIVKPKLCHSPPRVVPPTESPLPGWIGDSLSPSKPLADLTADG